MRNIVLVLCASAVVIAAFTHWAWTGPVQAQTVNRFNDWGGAVATGGTSQQLMPSAASLSRRMVLIENPCSATSQGIAAAENLFVNFDGIAASTSNGKSLELAPCGSLLLQPVSTGQITVNAATTGHQFFAKELQ